MRNYLSHVGIEIIEIFGILLIRLSSMLARKLHTKWSWQASYWIFNFVVHRTIHWLGRVKPVSVKIASFIARRQRRSDKRRSAVFWVSSIIYIQQSRCIISSHWKRCRFSIEIWLVEAYMHDASWNTFTAKERQNQLMKHYHYVISIAFIYFAWGSVRCHQALCAFMVYSNGAYVYKEVSP